MDHNFYITLPKQLSVTVNWRVYKLPRDGRKKEMIITAKCQYQPTQIIFPKSIHPY